MAKSKLVNVCIACLEDSFSLMDIDESDVKNKFSTLFNIEVSDFETFSHSICLACLTKLEAFYSFYEQVHNNLRSISVNTELNIIEDNGSVTEESSLDINPKSEDIQDAEIILIKIENDEIDNTNVKSEIDIEDMLLEDFDVMKKENSSSKDKYVCFYCQKVYRTLINFNLHIRSHTGQLPFKCSRCDRKFANRHKLNSHFRVHTKEKPFVCRVCEKPFRQHAALCSHMKLHTGKPEKCTLCEKSFCTKSELKLHMDKHMGIKKYLCSECGAAFGQKSHLTDHLKGHSDERPFQCELCDKAFKKGKLLKKHLIIHSGDKTFKCTDCSYACYTSHRLMEHQNIHKKQAKLEHF